MLFLAISYNFFTEFDVKLKLDDLNINWPVTGADLETWRVMNQLSKDEAANAFGLPMAKWYAITNPDTNAEVNSTQVITDKTVVHTLLLYKMYPQSAPINKPTDVTTFYKELGFLDDLTHRRKFAELIGRSISAVYRMIGQIPMMGTPSRPVQCLVDAMERLSSKVNLTPKEKVQIMEKIAKTVDKHHESANSKEGNQKKVKKRKGE